MNGEILQSVTEEADLGIIVSNDLKPSKQCVSAVKKANMTLGMIKRHIVSRDKNTIVRLYKSLVRPELEYCIQAWNPSLIKDIELHMYVYPSACAWTFMCLSVVCTCVCVCVCACVGACVRVRTRYVLVPCADPVSWPSGLDPLPLTKILDPRMGPSIHPSIHWKL